MKEKLYFEYLGTDVSDCKDISEALICSKLTYAVYKEPIYLKNKKEIPNYYATVKSSDNSVLGIVGKDYHVLNNDVGFEFVDELITKYSAKLVRAGEWNKGDRSFVVVALPDILFSVGRITPYLLITNCYDGSGSVKICLTPVIDNNVIIFKECKYTNIHSKNMNVVNCSDLIEYVHINMNDFVTMVESSLQYNFTDKELITKISHILGVNESMSNIKRERSMAIIKDIVDRFDKKDKFGNSLFKAIYSVAGYENHRETLRDTNNPEIFLYRILDSMPFLNKFLKEIKECLK